MGYHTYNLAEFHLSCIGEHDLYILFFTESYSRNRFAEAIGNKAVSITNRVKTIGWMFYDELPDLLKFASHATIMILSRNKSALDEFLIEYSGMDSWRTKSLSTLDATTRPNFHLTSIEDILLIVVPVYNRFENVMDDIAAMIRNGMIGQAIQEKRIGDLRERIQEITEVDTHLFKNIIIVDTVHGDWITKSRYEISDELFKYLLEIKSMITGLPQSKETNALLKELAVVRKEITKVVQEHSPLSLQVSAGFEAFGNGAKLLFNSQGLSISPLESAKRIFTKLFRKTIK